MGRSRLLPPQLPPTGERRSARLTPRDRSLVQFLR
jgi:hypothetical protein